MKAVNAITMLVVAVCAMLAASSCDSNPYVNIQGYAQGGTYTITVGVKDATVKPEQMKHHIDSLLNVVDFTVSGYNKESLLSKFNAGEIIVPNSILIDLYARSYAFWKESDGILDVASAPLFDIWGFGFTEGELPDDGTVKETMQNCGMRRLVPDMDLALSEDGTLDPQNLIDNACDNSAVLPKLNFNSVAQGYSVDLVSEYLYSVGVSDMLINIGGEIYCDGVNPGGRNWTLGIDKPVDGNNVTGEMLQGIFHTPGVPCGVVTSGNYRKFYVKDGKKYSHSIDPRSGYPVSHTLLSATIISTDPDLSAANEGYLSTRADALATISMVLGLDAASALIESLPNTEGCLIYDDNGAMKSWTSAGFSLQ